MGLRGPRGCTSDPPTPGVPSCCTFSSQRAPVCAGAQGHPHGHPKTQASWGRSGAGTSAESLTCRPTFCGAPRAAEGASWSGHRQPWPIVRLWVTDPGASRHVPAPLPARGAETHILSPAEPQGSPLSPSGPEAPARQEGSPLPPVHSRLHEKPGKRACASSQGEGGSSETAGHCPESHGTTRPAENGSPAPASSDHTAHPQENSGPGLPAAGAPSFPRSPCQELRLLGRGRTGPRQARPSGQEAQAPGGTQARGHLQDRQPVQAQGSRGGLAPSAASSLSPLPGRPAMSHLLVCPQKVPEERAQVTACTDRSMPLPRGTLVPLPGEASGRGLACGCALLPAPCVSGGASAWKQRGPAALAEAGLPPPPTGVRAWRMAAAETACGGPCGLPDHRATHRTPRTPQPGPKRAQGGAEGRPQSCRQPGHHDPTSARRTWGSVAHSCWGKSLLHPA